MTLKWIAAPGFVGSSGQLGLTDDQLMSRCAPGAAALPPDQKQPIIDGCRSQVNGVRGAARALFKDAEKTAASSRSIVSEIEKILEKVQTSIVAGNCSQARSFITSAKNKMVNLVANAEKMANLASQVSPMPNEAFGEEEVVSIDIQVGTLLTEVTALTDGIGGAVDGASVAVDECVPTPGPPGPPVTPAKVPKKKADLGLLLLGGAAVVAIGFALRGGGLG